MHHIDCPWRPADLAQREGRIIRQGNNNPKVHVYTYISRDTFDGYLFQTVEAKQKFISQIMTNKNPARTCKDIDESVLHFKEIKALCVGDVRIKEKMDLDIEVSKLQALKRGHESEQWRFQDNAEKFYPQEIKRTERYIEGLRSDLKLWNEHKDEKFQMTVFEFDDNLRKVTSKKTFVQEEKQEKEHENAKTKAGTALMKASENALGNINNTIDVGEYKGFQLTAIYSGFSDSRKLQLKASDGAAYNMELGDSAMGNITRMDNALEKIPKLLFSAEEYLKETKSNLEHATQQMNKPFPQEEELKKKIERLSELEIILSQDNRKRMPDVLRDCLTSETQDEIFLLDSKEYGLDMTKDKQELVDGVYERFMNEEYQKIINNWNPVENDPAWFGKEENKGQEYPQELIPTIERLKQDDRTKGNIDKKILDKAHGFIQETWGNIVNDRFHLFEAALNDIGYKCSVGKNEVTGSLYLHVAEQVSELDIPEEEAEYKISFADQDGHGEASDLCIKVTDSAIKNVESIVTFLQEKIVEKNAEQEGINVTPVTTSFKHEKTPPVSGAVQENSLSGRVKAITAAQISFEKIAQFEDAREIGKNIGPIVSISDTHFVQKTGSDLATVHKLEDFPQLPAMIQAIDFEPDHKIALIYNANGNKDIDLFPASRVSANYFAGRQPGCRGVWKISNPEPGVVYEGNILQDYGDCVLQKNAPNAYVLHPRKPLGLGEDSPIGSVKISWDANWKADVIGPALEKSKEGVSEAGSLSSIGKIGETKVFQPNNLNIKAFAGEIRYVDKEKGIVGMQCGNKILPVYIHQGKFIDPPREIEKNSKFTRPQNNFTRSVNSSGFER